MGASTGLLVISLACLLVQDQARKLLHAGTSEDGTGATAVLNAVLTATPLPDHSVIIITEINSPYDAMGEIEAPFGVGWFELEMNSVGGGGGNLTTTRISRVITQARRLRLTSWSVTMVVVSDDPAFLTTFAKWSLKGRLLVWSTRLLVLTRLPLHHLHHLRNTLAMTNSMFLKISLSPQLRCAIYVELPFSPDISKPVLIGVWTVDKGKIFTSRFPYFPEKFERLAHGPLLNVTQVAYPTTKTVVVDDPKAPGGKRVVIQDPEIRLFEIIGNAMNFTFQIKSPADQAWGVEMENGSFTGMIGMMQRKEVNIGMSLYHVTEGRSRVVDFTYPLTIWYSRIIVRRGNPKVDPWGFLLPLGYLVWLGVFTSLLGVMAVMALLAHCLPHPGKNRATSFVEISFNCVRVFLQEDISSVTAWWWWERVMLGVWMMMTVVLTQSYTGNLMSLLAVRYIPLPIQNLRDLLDSDVTAVTPAGTTQALSFLDAKDGILKQVGDLRHVGRFQPVYLSEMNTYLDQHVRRGTHVIILLDSRTPVMLAQDFSEKGRCDFYQAQEKILPMMASFATPKDSPLFPALNRRVMLIVESGLYNYWLQLYTPNYTACLQPPTKVAVKTTLSLNNLWGALVIGATGGSLSLLVFCLELLGSYATSKPTPPPPSSPRISTSQIPPSASTYTSPIPPSLLPPNAASSPHN